MSEARFLILEDYPPIARHLARLVRAHGLAVLASSVHEAMTALAELEHWSGLILDVGLPDGSGLDVLAQHRKARRGTPALVLTGGTDREAINTACILGAAYLVKPIATAAIERFLTSATDAGFAARLNRVVESWRKRYKLSQAEVDVLRRFAGGEDRGAIASGRGTSESTIRRQIASLVDHTGNVSLQAAVTRLLSEVARTI